MVVEVMGRHAGWIALHAGISTSADVILIPEIPYDLKKIAMYLRDSAGGRTRSWWSPKAPSNRATA